jgi:hypothetical protein
MWHSLSGHEMPKIETLVVQMPASLVTCDNLGLLRGQGREGALAGGKGAP